MPEQLIAIDGTTFVIAHRDGDISDVVHGLYARDTRYISTWELRLGGKRPRLLTAHHVDPYSCLCFLSNWEVPEIPSNAVSVMRRRIVGAGMEEEWVLTNHTAEALAFDLRLNVGADFLDLFEVKAREFAEPEDQVFTGGDARRMVEDRLLAGGRGLQFAHTDGAYTGQVDIEADPAPTAVDRLGFDWRVELPAHAVATFLVTVRLSIQGQPLAPTHTMGEFGTGGSQFPERLRRRRIVVPSLRTSWDKLFHVFQRSLSDLDALLIDDTSLEVSLPAAGLPWFMTVFGRDTLITSYQILPGGQRLGWGALRTLASLQATEDNPLTDAQPGRIVHELRSGPVALNGGAFPYYGTVDAPMLFLILLHEVWSWDGNDEMARSLRPAAEGVLRWMRDFGDSDGDGFIEYQRRSPKGLESQSWKDSWDSMRFHDGSIARTPVATCEVQGYAYDALRRTAALARGPWRDEALARDLDERADRLQAAFNERYWSDERGGFYHLALDRDKRPVDSITSNLGHLLWSGIVPEARAAQVAAQLLGPGLFSGWGVRTMSAEDHGYNPISYHCGTVWPHDNSIAVAGLHRYGFHDEANRIWAAMLDAAQHFTDFRLPEVFAGYDRDAGPFPVEYPTASSPQAWAAGAPLLMLRAGLGLRPDPVNRTVRLDPHLPAFVHHLRLSGCLAFDQLLDVEVDEGRASVEVAARVEEVAPNLVPSPL
ncbi:MAG TPA: glycogen debranching N-terminal domain-containing protein [Candidatus Dormibacteraeota bacterium]|nr:glycogen debranching N-terminal domain-containing protein [Candidatus Dormibacteraeota bacterium]